MRLPRIKKRLLIRLAIGLFLVFVFCSALFVFEYLGHDERIRDKYPKFGFVGDLPKVLDVFYLPLTIFRESKLPLYQLVIDPKDLKELDDSRPEGRLLLDEDTKRVPAKFIYDGRTYNVKVGYRGTFLDHWRYEKKSWRINFEDPEYFNGYASIDLIIPETRGFFSEEINNFRAKKFGLVVPDSRFIQLKINNKYYGPYWEAEHWNAGFLERHRLPPDANLYGEVNPWWQDLFYFASDWRKYSQDRISPVDNFAEVDLLTNLFTQADDWEFWQKIPLILDMDNFYRWHALNTLSGTIHSDSVHNIRLYFNNVLGKFQFIPWDISQGLEPTIDVNYNILASRILRNPEFLSERNKVLYDYIKDDKNLEDELAYYDKLYKETKLAFWEDETELYSHFYFDKKVSNRRKMFAIQYRSTQDAFKEEGRQAVIFDVTANQSKKNQIPLNLVASFKAMVRAFSDFKIAELTVTPNKEIIESVKRAKFYLYYDKNRNQILDKDDLKLADLTFNPTAEKLEASFLEPETYYNLYTERTFTNPSLPEVPNGEPVDIVQTVHQFFVVSDQRVLPPANLIFQNADLKLANVFTGETLKPQLVYADATTFEYLDEVTYNIQTFLSKNSIFSKGSGNEIILLPGNYDINKTIIIPKNLSLRIMAATQLNFAPGISLISYGPITAIGTASEPIIFTAQNISKPWGVVGVISAGKSIFNYTRFEHGGQAYVNGSFFSGMLSLFATDGEITNSQISYATGDDGVNVKYGQALIQNNYFYKNGFDALDLDWSDSQIINNTFIDNGNDGMDISGSRALIKNNLVRGSGDKCLSIGEKSEPIIFNNALISCNIGIASKDLSNPQIVNNVIYQNNEGISAYQKKPIFGGAKAEVYNTIIWGNKEQIKLDDKSTIKVASSDIENGWAGEGNVEINPEFLNNYLLPVGSQLNNLGNKEILKNLVEENLVQTPIGLIKELWPR